MINNTDQENIILNASISKFNNIFPTYISEKNPKFLEIDDKYIYFRFTFSAYVTVRKGE